MNIRKSLLITASVVVLSFIGFSSALAQDGSRSFYKGHTNFSLGLAGSHMWHFHNGNAYGLLSGGTQFQMEWGIHKYVGLGFSMGIQGGRWGAWGVWGNVGGPGFIAIPAGVVGNFHFYQLIADNTSKDIKADVLDIYGGLNLGSGIAFYPNNRNNTGNWAAPASALIWGGAHAGIRWYFNPRWALNGEIGFFAGKSFITAGVTYKIK